MVARWPRLLGAEEDDLEQTVLLDLLSALREERFRARSSLKTYVRTYVHHKCIDRIRARRRRQFLSVEDEDLEDPRGVTDEVFVSREEARRLLRLLDQMPQQCRELWSCLEEGLTYQEMSERLGVSEGALRVRVSRCRQRAAELRRALDGS